MKEGKHYQRPDQRDGERSEPAEIIGEKHEQLGSPLSGPSPPARIGHVDHLNAVDGVSVDQNHGVAVRLVGQLVTEYDTAAVSQHVGQGLDDLAGRFILR